MIGRAEAAGFLADKPVDWLWGVGRAMQRRLAADGILRIGQLRALDRRELAHRYGKLGLRLAELASGEDSRRVQPERARPLDLGRNDVSRATRPTRRRWRRRCGVCASIWRTV